MASMTEFLATRKPTESKEGKRDVAVATAKAFLEYANVTRGAISEPGGVVAERITAFLNDTGVSENSNKSSAARHCIAMYELLAQLVRGESVTWTDGKTYLLTAKPEPAAPALSSTVGGGTPAPRGNK